MSGLRGYIELLAGQFKSPVDEFLLKHGRSFEIDAETFVGGGVKQHCFMNAAHAAMGFPPFPPGVYCEGYFTMHGVPLAHAWIATPDGKVRDVTISDAKGVGEYFGVPFAEPFLAERLLKSKKYGILTGCEYPRDAAATIKAAPDKFLARGLAL